MPATFNALSVTDLIADINAANLDGGANTIVLAPSTTFSLTAVDNTTDGATGLPVGATGVQLTIRGNGGTIERSTAAETPDFRLFDVAAGGTLTLTDLTLQNGSADFGGAILNAGTATVEHCTVSGNSAPDGQGGGMFNLGTLTLEHSMLSGNSADGYTSQGGGIWNAGTLTLDHSILSGNHSDAESGGQSFGGGIYNGGTLTLDHSTLSDNHADGGFGGAIYNFSIVTLDHSTLSGNSADGSNSQGGGIWNAATLTLDHSKVLGNSAPLGGDLYNAGVLNLHDSTIGDVFP